MSADLEREAREAAVGRYTSVPDWASLGAAKQWELQDRERHFEYGYIAAATLREKEIGELRALLREACGILNDAIKTDETFWLEEMRGTNEDLTERIMLMLPPTPVPETKP